MRDGVWRRVWDRLDSVKLTPPENTPRKGRERKVNRRWGMGSEGNSNGYSEVRRGKHILGGGRGWNM